MIARHWRGWTDPTNADAYERLLRETVLPELDKIEGTAAATCCAARGQTRRNS